ncbi:integrase [Nitratireductor aestuarii]|uniref:Integrase n=1 Tax=Nitratireductor aestuarii TaxID=1735103 RepID=A0A916VZY0_9HYPH|nr:site-specific integrase [Nitratireductor aestuarii]GGA56590.1 integrase [Nitratireductor aestuarii]
MAKRVTALEIKNTPPGKTINVGDGLYYRATTKESGRWGFRFTSSDPDYIVRQESRGSKTRQREMGLGSYPAVSLSLAREKAQHAQSLVARGLDPIVESEREAEVNRAAALAKARAATFGSYADEIFLPWKTKGFHNAKHIYQWQRTFTHHTAALRDLQLADIKREDILAVLAPIWDEKHVTASRIRGRLEALFDHAKQNNAYHHDNPARWELFNATLTAPRKLTEGHLPAMPYKDVPDFIAALRQRSGSGALALEFAILTATRSGEVRLAQWSEFNFEERIWVIPAGRMKTRRDTKRKDHIVPLTDRMLAILEIARALHIKSPSKGDYVFPSAKCGAPISDMTLRVVMRRMGIDQYVPHGFRSAFRDWVSDETEFDPRLAEETLAHQLSEVEGSYRRGQAVKRRRVLLDAWGAYCSGRSLTLEENVIPIQAKTKGQV